MNVHKKSNINTIIAPNVIFQTRVGFDHSQSSEIYVRIGAKYAVKSFNMGTKNMRKASQKRANRY